MAPPPADRLESWKEIAAFLGRDERTAMRWAKEQGMPILRAPGLKRGRIYAYRSELRRWVESRSDGRNGQGSLEPIGEEESRIHSAASPSSDDAFSQRPSKNPMGNSEIFGRGFVRRISVRWKLAIAAVSLAAAFGLVGRFAVRVRAASTLRAAGFVELTDDGRYKRNLRTSGGRLYFNEMEGMHEVLASAPIQGGAITPIETPFTNVDLQDVSNDGKHLLVSSYEGAEAERKLWILPVQGGDAQRVGEISARYARWSPNNQRIAFSFGPAVEVVDADGSGPRVVGTFRWTPKYLTWSPDGKRLRFLLLDEASQERSAWEASFADETAIKITSVHRLSIDSDCCADWAWTRDGKYFAYLLSKPHSGTRLVLNPEQSIWPEWLDPKPSLPVTIGALEGLVPSTSSDALYVLTTSTERGQLLKYSVSEQAFETYLPGLSARYLSFSRDGKWIAYINIADASLWRCKADGSDAMQLSPAGVSAQLSSWSPDGTRIAFMGKVTGRPWRIFLVGKDGGSPEEAANGDDEQGAPTWSPDGRFLVYGIVFCQETHTCGIRRINLKTHQTQAVPGSQGLRTARWSPDGRFIAALQPETHDVMLFNVQTQRWSVLTGATTGDDLNWSHDSQFLYIDSLQDDKPIIDRVRIRDAQRFSVVGVSSLERMTGQLGVWFGLTADDSPLLVHLLQSSEVYALHLTGP